MEDIRTVTRLVTKNCFMCTIDLKDAYFFVRVNTNSRKYLRFVFENILYEFICLPFGLCSALYMFTTLMKPIISALRKMNVIIYIYLDDFFGYR